MFLRLGATAFGGPAAHIAMMEEECVRRRRWLDRQAFLDLLGTVQILPGPNSTEMAIHLGYLRAGWPGLVLGGVCFIVPAMALVWALAWAYVQYRTLPQVAGALYGMKPVIVAIVAQALYGFARTALRSWLAAAVAVAAAALSLAGVHELVLLAAAAAAGLLAGARPARGAGAAAVAFPGLGALAAAGGQGPGAAAATLGASGDAGGALGAAGAAATLGAAGAAAGWAPVFWFFLKVGSLLYGSGYVLLAFLDRELVRSLGWLTPGQLADAVAVGQFTPGPLFTTATFVGYLLAGHAGAVAATVGIFLPAFVLVAALAPWLPRLQRHPLVRRALDGVNAAAVGLLAAAAGRLAVAAVVDVPAALLALGALVVLLRTRLNSAWLVLAGAALGWAVRG